MSSARTMNSPVNLPCFLMSENLRPEKIPTNAACQALILGMLFFLTPIVLSAQQQQFAADLWHPGKIVLEGGDTLKGQLKYNLQNDVVQLQSHGRLETYTPRKIVFFEIFDQTVKRYRGFYSLPYTNAGQYKAPVFFELMEEGKMTLLCRESMEYKTYSSNYYYGSYTRLVLVNKFFFLKEDGSIVPFTGNKNDLLELMGTNGDNVKKYARQKKLNFDNKYGFGAMVNYYNTLVK
jgi:hypothetical protein